MEIVPNPFGGVNTHLWRNEAYIVGIVPVVRPAYSSQTRDGKEQVGKGLRAGFNDSRQKHGMLSQRKILNHRAEGGDVSFTEEAQGDTGRVGVADDRLSEKSQ